ncbi:MAG TPA: ABC transporter permease, partial [Candidatus Krumholzibacterium sp.]|nr:ABC transporter permease [Candidatus Krumholzibacterium sp.]
GFVMIALWVRDETSFDRFHKGNENIYQVITDGTKYFVGGFDGSPGPLGAACVEGIPEVTGSVKLGMMPKLAFRYGDNVFYEKSGMVVDASFLDIFSFELARGDAATALSSPSGILLTESMAERYFGSEDPVGKVMSSEGFEATVSGVLRDVPSNSTLQFDYVISFEFYRSLGGSDSYWSAYNYLTFLRLQEGADTKSVAALMTDIGRTNNSAQVSEDGCWYELHPFTGMHLSEHSHDRPFTRLGDRRLVIAFAIASLMILVLACINFMNLSTARAGQRAREIGLRKVIGADRAGIIRQFFGESLVFSVMAMIAAVLLIELAMPWFKSMSGKELGIAYS